MFKLLLFRIVIKYDIFDSLHLASHIHDSGHAVELKAQIFSWPKTNDCIAEIIWKINHTSYSYCWSITININIIIINEIVLNFVIHARAHLCCLYVTGDD